MTEASTHRPRCYFILPSRGCKKISEASRSFPFRKNVSYKNLWSLNRPHPGSENMKRRREFGTKRNGWWGLTDGNHWWGIKVCKVFPVTVNLALCTLEPDSELMAFELMAFELATSSLTSRCRFSFVTQSDFKLGLKWCVKRCEALSKSF